MSKLTESSEAVSTEGYEPWYKWGVLFLYLEMAIAVGVSVWERDIEGNGECG